MCKPLAWPPALAVLPFIPHLASANSLACVCLTSKSLGVGLLVQQLAQKDKIGICMDKVGIWEFALVFPFLSSGALSALEELIPFKCFRDDDVWGDCVKSCEMRAWLKSWGKSWSRPPGQWSLQVFSGAIVHIYQKG